MRRALIGVVLLGGCAVEPVFTHPGTTGDHGLATAIPNEIAVEWRDGTTPEQAAAIEKRFGLAAEAPVDGWRDEVAEVDTSGASENEETLLADLRADPHVASAEPEYEYDALFVPNDPEYQKQWHMQQIGAETAWDWGTGSDVVVAVIDTGVSKLSDLSPEQLVPGYDFVKHTAIAEDDQGHGSHVAGTIAQSTNNATGVTGLAHGAKIMPIKVLNAFGHGTTAHIAEGIRWAVDHGAKVLNLSLGGGGYSAVLAHAVAYARSHGVVVVCAAGNGGGPPVSYPAAYEGAIAVSAVRFDRQLAPYSSYGPEVTLAGPGGDKSVDQNKDGFPDGVLQQTLTGFEWYQGTSMATPHVAAAAALLAGAGVTRAEAIQSILERTATPLGDARKYGAGEVDAGAALKHVRFYGGLWRLGIAALMALAAGWLVGRREGRGGGLGLTGIVGLTITSSGLIFLPLLGYGHTEIGRILSSPLPEWGQLLHGTMTANPLWMSALGPFLILGASRVRWLHGLVAGLCLGYAGYLAHGAAVGWMDLAWIPGRTLEAAWLGGNAFVAFILGMVALRPR
jgi:serine protease